KQVFCCPVGLAKIDGLCAEDVSKIVEAFDRSQMEAFQLSIEEEERSNPFVS
ncbi:hypothetical protein BGZ46_010502, partial [Entomortierella lignicola]